MKKQNKVKSKDKKSNSKTKTKKSTVNSISKKKKTAIKNKNNSKKVTKRTSNNRITKTGKVEKKKINSKKNIKSKKRIVKRKTPRKTNDVIRINYEEPTFSILEEQVVDNKQNKEKSSSEFTLIGIVVCLGFLLAVSIFMLFRSNAGLLNLGSSVEDEIIRELPKEADPIYKDTWQEFHSKAFVPDDYIGQIIFESEIINEPVLQGDTNETYIRRNYETYKYEICGPVFMDYICDVNTDQNLILYGHNRSTSIDPEHVMMFSPLHVLEKEENYDANKLIYMAYEDRLDIYLVACVYRVKVVEKEDGNQYLVKGEPLYYLNNYSPDQFDTYYRTIKQKQLYDTGVELVNTDKLLTLQTCYENSIDKLIVLAKRIGTVNYKETNN